MGLPDLSGQLNAVEMIERLAGITDEPPGLTRTFLSRASRTAKRTVAAWMNAAGLDVHEDAAGNVIGRRAAGDAGAPVLACGSHLDTVRNAGRFDGALGVCVAIEAAARTGPLPFTLEVVGFSDEEGVRFQTPYLGSRFYAGDPAVASLPLRDAAGVSLTEALERHKPDFPPPPPRRLAAYVEVHIEQGPILEAADRPLGVVTAIAGQTRLRITLTGAASHAGTTPMALRRDALCGAAEVICRIEREARDLTGLVATVGVIDVIGGASNVVPGSAVFTVDIRHPEDARRAKFVARLGTFLAEIARRRGLEADVATFLEEPAVACDPALVDVLATALGTGSAPPLRLVSGAGHDAVALARVCPVGMLFVRSRAGVSHHPDEFTAPGDVEAAAEALARFLKSYHP